MKNIKENRKEKNSAKRKKPKTLMKKKAWKCQKERKMFLL